eukprot:scaffold121808_cov29-Tisochrysis_lutea.AAC.1
MRVARAGTHPQGLPKGRTLALNLCNAHHRASPVEGLANSQGKSDRLWHAHPDLADPEFWLQGKGPPINPCALPTSHGAVHLFAVKYNANLEVTCTATL